MSIKHAIKNISPRLKEIINLQYKVFFTFINKIRIFLHLDKTSNDKIWKERGKKNNLLDVQIDGYEKRYKELEIIFEEIRNNLKNYFRKKLFSGANILDYGCGSGRYIDFFYPIKNINIVGVDISESILNNFTKKKFPQGKFACADLSEDNDFVIKHGDTFDGIYCISVIQHIRYTKLPSLIKNFYRLLKKRGILYLSFPHPNSRWDVVSNLNYIRYYPETIEKYLKKTGFKIDESYSLHHKEHIKKIDNSGLPNFGYVIVSEKD